MTIMSENKLCAVTKKASNEVAASSSTERKKDANNEEQENLSRVESEEDEVLGKRGLHKKNKK